MNGIFVSCMENKTDNPYVLSKYDLLGDIARDCPRAVELLAEYGLHCVSCFANEIDTLEQGASVHAMTTEELDEMIEEINQELEKEWRDTHRVKA